MIRFVGQVGAFLSLVFLVLQGVGWGLIKTGNQGHAVENSRIYRCLKKARQSWPETEVFVLGDSVTNQMYPPEATTGRINSLALVMPSTLAGQYFLLKRLANTNDLEGKTIALVLSPEGFAGELNPHSSYHYVLKPFHNTEFKPWEDAFYRDRVNRNFVVSFSQWPIVKCSNWTPPAWMPYLKEDALVAEGGLSKLAEYYLIKIEFLLAEAGAELRVLPTIQPESEAGTRYEELRARAQEAGLGHMFQSYFEHFHYIEDSQFRDGAHLKDRSVLGENVLDL